MEYEIEPSKWGPYILVDDKMIFYDFILDKSIYAKDLPSKIENPIITYHMWYSPKEPKRDEAGDILAARTLEGLEQVLEIAKKEALKRATNKEDHETIK